MTKMSEVMVQEKARKEKALRSDAVCPFGDGDDTEEITRQHGIAETSNGVAVGWRDGFFGTGHIVALFYWTGSAERSVTMKAAEDYADLLNTKNILKHIE